MNTISKNSDKKNIPVKGSTHKTATDLKEKFNFTSYDKLEKKFHEITEYHKLDLSLPKKDVFPGTGKEFHLGIKELKKLLEEQKADIKDLFIQHHRSEGENKFFALLIEDYRKYDEIRKASDEKDKMIIAINANYRK